LGAALLVVVCGAGAAWYLVSGLRVARTDLITHTVKRENLTVTIVERGALESADNRDIFCRVKARGQGSTVATTIRWLIEDGSQVERGQLLIELDDSGLEDQLKTQTILVNQREAEANQAAHEYEIVLSQNFSDIEFAKTQVTLAEIALKKYEEGDYLYRERDILGRLSVAESDQEMWRDRVAWSERMLKRGFISANTAQAEKSKQENAIISLKRVVDELRVLQEYEKRQMLTDLQSKLDEAKRNLDRVKHQAEGKRQKAHIDLLTKEVVHRKELERLRDIEDEMRKCKVYAPQDGMVVYFQSEQSRFGSGSRQSIVAQGEPVNEGQKLMRIPDLSQMQVNVKVHEAMVARVRGERRESTGFGEGVYGALMTPLDLLTRVAGMSTFAELRDRFKDKDKRMVYPGQQARIKVDAFPNRIFQGHVRTVATVPSQTDYYSTDVKVYPTIVSIDEKIEGLGLKPGMSAEVTILAGNKLENVLTAPVQAILGSAAMGKFRTCYVLTPDGPVEREIEVGLSNEKMVEIKAGLKEGDEVIVNPRVLLKDKSQEGVVGDRTIPGRGVPGDWRPEPGEGNDGGMEAPRPGGKGAKKGGGRGGRGGPGGPGGPGGDRPPEGGED
jgi:multidrug efflux pump subunit AcrA (membrane-fusion protein)